MGHIEFPDIGPGLFLMLLLSPVLTLAVLATLWPFDGPADFALLGLFGVVMLTAGVIYHRIETGPFEGVAQGGGAGYDITNDPLDPAQKAKENWEEAVDSITEEGDEQN